MSTVVIEVSEVRNFDDDCINELIDFLGERLKCKVAQGKKEITLEFEIGSEASRSYLRLLLRKFLHRALLREDFRIISGGENTFVIKEKKTYSE